MAPDGAGAEPLAALWPDRVSSCSRPARRDRMAANSDTGEISCPSRTALPNCFPTSPAWRRDLHAHPEILFETHRTARIVAEKLDAIRL